MKDKRRNTVKILIETKNVSTFADIFEHIPKTAVADELGFNFARLKRMTEDVTLIKVNDIFLFAGYFEVDAKVIFELIYNQRSGKKVANRPKK